MGNILNELEIIEDHFISLKDDLADANISICIDISSPGFSHRKVEISSIKSDCMDMAISYFNSAIKRLSIDYEILEYGFSTRHIYLTIMRKIL